MKPTNVLRTELFLLFFMLMGLALSPPAFSDTTVGGTISTDTTWTVAGSPYIVSGSVLITGTDGTDGVTTLTIEAGTDVRFNSGGYITIGGSSGDPGAIRALGTTEAPILFTSAQSPPSPGSWYGLYFYNTADDTTSLLEHCIFEYSGQGGYGVLNIRNSAPTVRNCQFNDNAHYDFLYSGSVGGQVTGCTIRSGISLLSTGSPDFSGNTIYYNNTLFIKAYPDNVSDVVTDNTYLDVDSASFIDVQAGTVTKDATWTAAIPYRINGRMLVQGIDGTDAVTTLVIEAGAQIEFQLSAYIEVGASSGNPGALVCQGTADQQILFTSAKASPAPGDWYGLYFYDTTDDATSVMEHCVVEYSGYGNYGAVNIYNAKPALRNCMLRYNQDEAVYVTGTGSNDLNINCNTFSNNNYGIYLAGNASPSIQNNNFAGNTSYGLYNGSSSVSVVAENNWWGDVNGPNTGGDSTYGNVDADPWSTAENQCVAQGQNNPPNEPNTPGPADGSVRVDVTSGLKLLWTGGDPDILDTVLYDLYRGTSADSLSLLAQNIGIATYQMTDAVQGQTYYWKIVAKDNHGLETSGSVWQFTTDGEPPDLIVSSLSIDPPGNLQPGQQVTFTAQISNVGLGPVVDVFEVDIKINGASIGLQPVAAIMPAGGDATISKTWTYDTGDPTLEVTTDSQFTVTETIENNNQYIALLSELADNTAPSLVANAPSSGDQLQQIQQITVTLTDGQSQVDDAAVIAGFAVTDQAQQPVAGSIVEANDTFTFTPQNLPLADGTYQVSVTAADTLGNQQLYQFSFIIDTQPPAKPVVTGATVASGTIQPRPATNQADDFMAPLEGMRDAGTSLWINGTQYLPEGSGAWAVDLTLQQGDNALEVWCVDQAGNQSESEWVDIYVEPSNGLIFEYNDSGRMKRVRRIQ